MLLAAQERLQRYLKPSAGTFSEEEFATARYEERTLSTRLLAAHASTRSVRPRSPSFVFKLPHPDL